MTREEAIKILKAFMENPLFSDVHKAAFNIAIHDIKAHHDWDINNLILINKDNYEPLEQEPVIRHNKVKDELIRVKDELEPTTKNDLGVEKIEVHKPCINYEDGCEEWAGCPCVYYKAGRK